MDIMSLFRQAPQQQQPAPQIPTGNPNPGVPLPGTQQTVQTAPNGLVPEQIPGANPGNPGNSTDPVSPLDKHAKIWETVNDPNAKPDTGYFGTIDPAKVLESARKVDFTKSLPADILAKINAGGAEANQAFLQALNAVAQTVYANSAIAATKIAEQGLDKSAARINQGIPDMVRRLSANEGLRTENPIFSNPAIAPLVEAMTTQFSTKNPNATTSEIQTQVADYFSSLGTVFAPKPVETSAEIRANKAAKDQDWSLFLNS